MGRGGCYIINEDGEEVLVEEPTAPAPEPRPIDPDTAFPQEAAISPLAAPGGKRGRGGPSAAASPTPTAEE